jgi:hypothetical protein
MEGPCAELISASRRPLLAERKACAMYRFKTSRANGSGNATDDPAPSRRPFQRNGSWKSGLIIRVLRPVNALSPRPVHGVTRSSKSAGEPESQQNQDSFTVPTHGRAATRLRPHSRQWLTHQ